MTTEMGDSAHVAIKPPLDRRTVWAAGFACLMMVLAVASANTVVDLDLFHQMALFRELLNSGTMPHADTFAYTPTLETVVHHEWGTGAIHYFAIVASGLGSGGLMALKYIVTFSICLVCFQTAKNFGGVFELIALAVPVALLVGGYTGFTNVRAQMFTLLFLTLQYLMLSWDAKGSRLWCLAWVPMFIVWGNLHGGAVAGAGILGVYTASRIFDSWLNQQTLKESIKASWHRIVLLASVPFLLCVNPYGWTYVPYLVRALSMERRLIGEWQPIWTSPNVSLIGIFVLAIVVAGSAMLMRFQTASVLESRWKDRMQRLSDDIFPMLAITLTAYLATKHIRHVSIFAVTWFCFAPGLLSRTEICESVQNLFRAHPKRVLRASLAVAMLAIAMSFNAQFWSLQVPQVERDDLRGAPIYPVAAVNFLQQQEIEGNLMTPFATGAYVSWRMYPQIKVSIDSRYEAAYPEGSVEESVAFYRAHSLWQQTLEKYPTDMILVPNREKIYAALTKAIKAQQLPWSCIYHDASFTIFAKEDAVINRNYSRRQALGWPFEATLF